MVRKVLNGLSYATLFVAWALVAVGVYWTFFDKTPPPVTVVKLLSPVEEVAHVGDTLKIEYNVIRNRACHLNYTRYLEDERDSPSEITTIFVIEQGERDLLPDQLGQPIDIAVRFTLLYSIPPGVYLFYSRTSYACNPMQRFFPIVVDTPRVRVTVKPKE